MQLIYSQQVRRQHARLLPCIITCLLSSRLSEPSLSSSADCNLTPRTDHRGTQKQLTSLINNSSHHSSTTAAQITRKHHHSTRQQLTSFINNTTARNNATAVLSNVISREKSTTVHLLRLVGARLSWVDPRCCLRLDLACITN